MKAFLILMTALSALRADSVPAMPTVHDVNPAEQEVYASYLNQNFKLSKNDGPLARSAILVENETQDLYQKNRRAWVAFLTKNVSGPGRASDACLAAFLSRTPQTLRFFSFPATRHAVRLVRSDELQHALEAGGWDGFYAAYPGAQGILSFGAIAFGSEGQEALFTVRSQCGRHCGYRDIVYMQKINGAWLTILKEALP